MSFGHEMGGSGVRLGIQGFLFGPKWLWDLGLRVRPGQISASFRSRCHPRTCCQPRTWCPENSEMGASALAEIVYAWFLCWLEGWRAEGFLCVWAHVRIGSGLGARDHSKHVIRTEGIASSELGVLIKGRADECTAGATQNRSS